MGNGLILLLPLAYSCPLAGVDISAMCLTVFLRTRYLLFLDMYFLGVLGLVDIESIANLILAVNIRCSNYSK